jgi:hypothetical protein
VDDVRALVVEPLKQLGTQVLLLSRVGGLEQFGVEGGAGRVVPVTVVDSAALEEPARVADADDAGGPVSVGEGPVLEVRVVGGGAEIDDFDGNSGRGGLLREDLCRVDQTAVFPEWWSR